MSEEVITQETVPEEPLESSAEGGGADDSQFLEKLNETLGKEFKDVETALKSVKDTFSYVGKQDDILNTAKEVMKNTGLDQDAFIENLKSMSQQETPKPKEQAPEEKSDDLSSIKAEIQAQYQEDRFFDKNPQLEQIKDYLKPIKNASDEYKSMSWDEFAKTEQVSKLSETFAGYEEANSKKSVVESNPKLGAITDKIKQAKQALESNDDQTAKSTAVRAIMDTLE